ncbi:MAG: type II CRISPR RNA-guided endonuclease Cas9 [Bacteroidia bacterium]
MKKILGLDLGVASIGWAIVEENNEKQELLTSGVRIIPIDTETANNYSKGAATSKNQDRQLKRSARRNNQRYKLRKHFLNKFLEENNLFPIPVELFKMDSLKLYGLRHKALNEKITLQELARIWFHLNQKRGYIDSRKGQSEEDKDTKYVEIIKARSKNLYENYLTVGSYFHHKLLENPFYRIKSGDDKENIFLVDDYKIEFDLIWNKQKEFYPEFLSDKNYDRVRNKIIYYKRKLKSQKHLIGECRFELKHKCMPISSPIAQELRLWQDVNKVRIKDKYNNETELTKENKIDLFQYLNENEKITEKDFLKRYINEANSKNYKTNFEKQLRGYVFKVKLINLLKEHNIDETIFDDFDALQNNFSEHPLFKIWHLLYATEESKDIKKILQEKYFFNDELISGILKLSLKNDFAALSSRAARKLIPHLREGLMYDQACKKAGYNHSNSLTKEENELKEIISIDKLKNIKPNELRNPTVEKILNQLINLLKGLNKDGYSFDEIRIELARDLKKNAKERQKITKQNAANEAFTKKCIDDLVKEGYGKPSKRDIDKYKLWLEFERCSPYEPNNTIKLADLFDKAKYEIEHIIPKSRYFDDSLNNKTIARVHINKEKGNQTAYDYMKTKQPELLHQYEECIKRTKLSRAKRNNLLMLGTEIPDDFINRQLNETRYITKETLKILKTVCKNVTSTSGTVTDYLRHNWGYDNVLMDLNFERISPEEIEIKEINGQKRKVIKDWTKRNDNRHHAVDAIVIACTKQSHIQQLNKLNSFFDKPQDLKPVAIKAKIPFEYEIVKNNIANILVSFKAGKKVATIKKVGLDKWGKVPKNFGQVTLVPRGRLHEESVYGSNHKQQKIDIKKLTNVNQCVVGWQQELIEKHIAKYNNDLKTSLLNLKKDPIIYGDNLSLEKVTIFVDENVKKYNLQYTATNKFDIKAASSIVNKNVKDIIIARLKANDNDPAKAFKNLKENPVYFNKEKGIEIKSVRCYTGGSDYPALHERANGVTLNNKQGKKITDKKPVDFVKGGNNHHIAIYEDEQGNRFEECVSFFEAFKLKQSGLDVIQRNHTKGYKFIVSLQQNEMFVFGLNKQELEHAIEQNNTSIIGKHLYRVQKIQSKDYTFRHHLETKLDDSKSAKEYKKFIRISSLANLNGIKVRVGNTNKISILND